MRLLTPSVSISCASTERWRFLVETECRGVPVAGARFQGEENEVIILSLTRGKALTRFLKTQNRINVASSRARCAFVALGNPEMLLQLPDWREILGRMDVAKHSRSEGFLSNGTLACCE